mmetsp:Transcript_39048/g.76126  ORF Transcript_39048/g.76126 Transcript_39048/m.76126 type:complete len:160 (-) Transcript_39048:873-1352(-)
MSGISSSSIPSSSSNRGIGNDESGGRDKLRTSSTQRYYFVRHLQGAGIPGDYDGSVVDILYAFVKKEDAMEAARQAAEERNNKYWAGYPPMEVEEIPDGYCQRGETHNRHFIARAVAVEVDGKDDAPSLASGGWLWAINVEQEYEPHGLEALFIGNEVG